MRWSASARDAAALLAAGQHGTTFGGNPVATAAGLAVLRVIERTDLLDHVRRLGARLAESLRGLGFVTGVRQYGLLVGVDVAVPAGTAVPDAGLAPAMVSAGLQAGYMLNATGPDTLRLAPPLVIGDDLVDALIADLPRIHAAALAGASAPSGQGGPTRTPGDQATTTVPNQALRHFLRGRPTSRPPSSPRCWTWPRR